MAIDNFHPNIATWFLFERDDPSQILYFQFNPSEMNVDVVADWEEVDVANIAVQTTQFKQRKPKVFTFDLFLNEWGNHSQPNNDKPFLLSVEEQINWLDQRMFPRQTRLSETYSPPILIFKWREYEPVIIAKMSVKRTHFRPGRDTSQFTQNFRTNTLFSTFNRFTTSPQEFSNRTPQKAFTAYQPGDAIRATVSITLLEYRKSTATSNKGFLERIREFFSNNVGL